MTDGGHRYCNGIVVVNNNTVTIIGQSLLYAIVAKARYNKKCD